MSETTNPCLRILPHKARRIIPSTSTHAGLFRMAVTATGWNGAVSRQEWGKRRFGGKERLLMNRHRPIGGRQSVVSRADSSCSSRVTGSLRAMQGEKSKRTEKVGSISARVSRDIRAQTAILAPFLSGLYITKCALYTAPDTALESARRHLELVLKQVQSTATVPAPILSYW